MKQKEEVKEQTSKRGREADRKEGRWRIRRKGKSGGADRKEGRWRIRRKGKSGGSDGKQQVEEQTERQGEGAKEEEEKTDRE
jgi:hypothetical protein